MTNGETNDETTIDWNSSEKDNFFDRIKKWFKNNDRLKDWGYTIGIFFLVTLILTLPLYLIMSSEALLLLPAMVIMGFIVALFTAYILTPLGLRHYKKYTGDPEVQQYLEELAGQAQVSIPKLLVTETPEINAMAFTSVFGGRVCLTRGIIDAYHRGDISGDELKAIIGHEIGHIKHKDCFKRAFVISWISIFDLIGTILLVLGGAFIATGAITTVLSDRDNSGPLLALMGVFMVIAGIIQRLLGKLASVPALHLSRTNEYAADLTGAQLTTPDTFISALKKIELYNNQLVAKQLAQLPLADQWQAAPRNMSWIDGLFSTHPPTDMRVSRLEEISGSQSYYQGPPAPFTASSPTPAATSPVSSTGPQVTGKKYGDLYDTPLPKPGPGPDNVSGPGKAKLSRKSAVIPIVLTAGMILACVFFIIPSLVQSTPHLTTFPNTAVPTPPPTPDVHVSTFPTSPLTSIPATQAPSAVTPLSFGQSAVVTVPYSETMEFNYNTIHRYFATTKTLTLEYDVIANQITEVKEFSSASGYSEKKVTQNDPNAYLLITIRDSQSGNILATSGFGRTNSYAPHQQIIVRKTGNLEMEVTGAKVTVDLAIT